LTFAMPLSAGTARLFPFREKSTSPRSYLWPEVAEWK